MSKPRKTQTKKPKVFDLNGPVIEIQAGPVYTFPDMGYASIIITNIYRPNKGTGMMVKSFEDQGHELAILTNKFEGNGQVLKHLYECYKRAATGHEYFCYSDGADTFCQRPVYVPTDHILYSTEKNCYPHVEMMKEYSYDGPSPFRYLNGGGYGGPLILMIEFMEKYGLTKQKNDCNGQHEQMVAFLQAEKDGFPIKLDYKCEVFQTTAFTNDTELEVVEGFVINKLTDTVPAIIHGNGLSDMSWVYKGVGGPKEAKLPT